MKKVTVLGDGAWGTAVAMTLADNDCNVMLWCHYHEIAEEIKTQHTNKRFLPGFTLPNNIISTTDIQEACEHSSYIFVAIPVLYLRSVITTMRPYITNDHILISLSKGIEDRTLALPTDVMKDELGHNLSVAIVAGPNFAHEVADKQITAMTVAVEHEKHAVVIRSLLSNEYIKLYTSDDLTGVQVGGALKNVISMAIGMAEGAGLSENSKAFLFTRGFKEIVTIAHALGGRQETLYGLSGIGDLVMSAYGKGGRNRTCGMLLGQGKSLEEVRQQYETLPEGINTIHSLHTLIKKHHLNMPICTYMYSIIEGSSSINNLMAELLTRNEENEY